MQFSSGDFKTSISTCIGMLDAEECTQTDIRKRLLDQWLKELKHLLTLGCFKRDIIYSRLSAREIAMGKLPLCNIIGPYSYKTRAQECGIEHVNKKLRGFHGGGHVITQQIDNHDCQHACLKLA